MKSYGHTGFWIGNVIAGTSKTSTFFKPILETNNTAGCYLRVSDGVETLSSKLRKKISSRFKKGLGYPNSIWINFGRTVEQVQLKAFADFSEEILDGMFDDNFKNSSSEDFIALPYLNLIVTVNNFPNLDSFPNL